MDWMPSCESPASRITASRMCCGRRSARPALVVGAGADSGKTEGVLTWVARKYGDAGEVVKRGAGSKVVYQFENDGALK